VCVCVCVCIDTFSRASRISVVMRKPERLKRENTHTHTDTLKSVYICISISKSLPVDAQSWNRNYKERRYPPGRQICFEVTVFFC